MDVTFEIKVYENDWEYILKGKYLNQIIERCNFSFKKKVLIINNVIDIHRVKVFADKKILEGVLDEYFFVSDYADQVLEFFKIRKESFKGGYYYSIAELVGIYLCSTEYLLHFSSDSFLELSSVKWIENAIKIFTEREDVIVANPVWNFSYNEAKNESILENDEFYIGYGFSDQCYLIKCKTFKELNYDEKHIDSDRYPDYGGELFEKRVDSFMRNNNKLRITSKKISYIHLNFPFKKSGLLRLLYVKCQIYKRLKVKK